MEKPQAQNQVQIPIDMSDVEGTYANLANVHYTPSEFILDFARYLPGSPKGKVYARIVMTPQNARALLRLLEARIGAYETQFGKIPGQGEPAHTRDIGFKPETP
ncbi:MAG: DUF3467 domain-containing protein [Candidatus Eisenbacteria bacterium]|nr:DUF3467 domain-containing protein [Candidatus Eisenbacteria bacterium]